MRGRRRDEPDEIVSAIHVLRQRSEEWRGVYDETMLAFLGEKLGVPPADGIPTAEYLVRAMRAAARDELQLTRSIEGQWTRDGSVYTLTWHPRGDVPLHVIVELDPVHVFLGPATRLS